MMFTHLTIQTTLEDYEHCCGFDKAPGERREKWNGFRKMVELVLAEGGELWEWQSEKGDTGFAAGLAVVRDGEVFKQWQLTRVPG